jgi:hypothetical protein
MAVEYVEVDMSIFGSAPPRRKKEQKHEAFTTKWFDSERDDFEEKSRSCP